MALNLSGKGNCEQVPNRKEDANDNLMAHVQQSTMALDLSEKKKLDGDITCKENQDGITPEKVKALAKRIKDLEEYFEKLKERKSTEEGCGSSSTV